MERLVNISTDILITLNKLGQKPFALTVDGRDNLCERLLHR